MKFSEAVKSGLAMNRNWRGRSSRSEFWWFCLFFVLGSFVMSIIAGVALSLSESVGNLIALPCVVLWFNWLSATLSVSVRRLHDVNKSAWYLLFPIYNWILFVFPGTNGANKYGEITNAEKAPV